MARNKLAMTTPWLKSFLRIGAFALGLVFLSESVQAKCHEHKTQGLMTCAAPPEKPLSGSILEEVALEAEELPFTPQSTPTPLQTQTDLLPTVEILRTKETSETNSFTEFVSIDLVRPKVSKQAGDLLSSDAVSETEATPETDSAVEFAPTDQAQSETSANAPNSANESVWRRSKLTGDWGGLRSQLSESGVTFDLEFTQFLQGLSVGSGSRTFDYGGRLDALIDFDTEKLGLWKGGGFHTHLEYRYGSLAGYQDGIIFPVNTGMALPLLSPDTLVASSLYLSQQIGARTSLLIGKINVLDLLARDLFFGGWGTQRFMNLAFVAPPSGVLPPVIIGAITNVRTEPVAFSFMVYDPNDQTNIYWPNDLFAEGVNFSVSATHVGTISNRPTTYSLTATYSTKNRTDLEDVLLPPGLETRTRSGSYNITFQFSHLLHINPEHPREGWGVFLRAAIADGNPNPIQSSVITGLGGKGLFQERPQDSFGLGFFYYNFSNDLQDTLNPLTTFVNEYGIEAYYRYDITPWFHLTPNLQYVNPARQDSNNALVLGLRAGIRF